MVRSAAFLPTRLLFPVVPAPVPQNKRHLAGFLSFTQFSLVFWAQLPPSRGFSVPRVPVPRPACGPESPGSLVRTPVPGLRLPALHRWLRHRHLVLNKLPGDSGLSQAGEPLTAPGHSPNPDTTPAGYSRCPHPDVVQAYFSLFGP